MNIQRANPQARFASDSASKGRAREAEMALSSRFRSGPDMHKGVRGGAGFALDLADGLELLRLRAFLNPDCQRLVQVNGRFGTYVAKSRWPVIGLVFVRAK